MAASANDSAVETGAASGLAASHVNEKTNDDRETDSAASMPPLSASWREEPLSQTEHDKVQSILRACRDGELSALSELATSQGGLVEDEVRRTAWPMLLGCASNQSAASGREGLGAHRDEDQVQLDVNRSFVYYPEDETEKRKDARKQELSDVIVAVLRAHPMLHYFQGYHDIIQVLLLVLGAHAAVPAAARLSLLRIRDFMLPTMSGTEPHLQLLPAILFAVDPVLYQHLRHTQPFFALAATLTLYAHDIEEYGSIARLFDYLLAGEAVIPIYLYAVIVMSRRDELLDIEEDEPEMLFAILSKLPKPLNLEALIARTSETFESHPPERLPGRAWARVSAYSALKTTRDPHALARQTLAEGELMFEKQAAEIRRADEWKRRKAQLRQVTKKYRRPATYTGATVAVLFLAYWFRNGNARASVGGLLLVFDRLREQGLAILRSYLF